MIKRLSVIGKVALTLVVIASCLFGQVLAEDRARVRVKGSNEWANIVAGRATSFMSKNPGVIVLVSGGGSRVGMEAVFRHETEIALTSHFLDEDLKKTAADLGMDLQERLASWDAVAVFVNRDNPVSELTIDHTNYLGMLPGSAIKYGVPGIVQASG